MLRTCLASCLLVLLGLVPGVGLACANSGGAERGGVGLAVVDFDYIDTSGDPGDQTAAHEKRLQALMAALRRDLMTDGQFRLVPVSCGTTRCTADGLAPADLLRAAAAAGAKVLVIGGIHKQSTLIQWAKVEAIDLAADRVVFDKLFTFRGDSDEAWDRAEAFMSREICGALAPQ